MTIQLLTDDQNENGRQRKGNGHDDVCISLINGTSIVKAGGNTQRSCGITSGVLCVIVYLDSAGGMSLTT